MFLQARNVFLGSDLVEGGAIDELPLQLGDFLGTVELHPRYLFSLPVTPDTVQVTQELVYETWGQVVAVTLSEVVCQSECLLRHPLVLLLFHIHLSDTLDLSA